MILVHIDQSSRPYTVGGVVECDPGWEGLCRYFNEWRTYADAVFANE
jgi:hypothetical protein